MNTTINVALIGNPNTGKTSLFNLLTGANQKVGNYPGITTEKKTGTFSLKNKTKVNLIDLPGTYSLNTQSIDEKVTLDILLDKSNENHPALILVVAEVENLKKNLLLFTQIRDLNIPTYLIINMEDVMKKKNINIDIEKLSEEFNHKVILISTRNKTGIIEIYDSIENISNHSFSKTIDLESLNPEYFKALKVENEEDLYVNWLKKSNENLENEAEKQKLKKIHSGDFK
jgi:ferrous iron transport protein B